MLRILIVRPDKSIEKCDVAGTEGVIEAFRSFSKEIEEAERRKRDGATFAVADTDGKRRYSISVSSEGRFLPMLTSPAGNGGGPGNHELEDVVRSIGLFCEGRDAELHELVDSKTFTYERKGCGSTSASALPLGLAMTLGAAALLFA